MISDQDYRRLCRVLRLDSLPKQLLLQALTHSSALSERRLTPQESNERLEFLGDAVIEICVSSGLYSLYPEANEGELTKMRAALVCEESLARMAKQLDLGSLIILGRGEMQSNGAQKPAILADTFEALIGAIFLAKGYGVTERVIETLLLNNDNLGSLPEQEEHQWKSRLQEFLQRSGNCELIYSSRQTGLDHKPTFYVEVSVKGRIIGTGSGGTKKVAEQAAARQALEKLQSETEQS